MDFETKMMNLQELFHQIVLVYFINLFYLIYYKVKEKYIFKNILFYHLSEISG